MMRTPGLVRFVIGGSLIALAVIAGPARAQAQTQTQAQTQQASAPVVRPPSGAHLIPYLGVSSFAGSSGNGLGAGFRAGALAGGHVNPRFSVNGEITMDLLNPKNAGNADFTGIDLDLAVSPFFHVPLNNVEIVVGPKLGAWFGRSNASASAGGFSVATKDTSRGWLAGLNAGAFLSLNSSLELGGLLSFVLRNPTQECTTMEGTLVPGVQSCTGSGLSAGKVLAFTIALLF